VSFSHYVKPLPSRCIAHGGSAVARFTGSIRILLLATWGLRPRLYSAARFAGSARNNEVALLA